ncbi:MAG: glycosyltransferase family 9 protein [Desulfomonilia bacterium]|nr:glycosyltransferase family 9 protein [Desulfomonilia bacterium]
MDVLFVKLGAMGDVVNTLPLAVTLKIHLKARIHWLVEPLSFPLVSGHPSVDSVVLFDKNRLHLSVPKIIIQLSKGYWDISLDLQRTAKSSLMCMISRSTRRIGFDRQRCKEMTWIMPFERIPKSDPSAHMVYQYLEFAKHLGVPDNDIRWEIPVTGIPSHALPQEYLVLNIGATKPANRWTAEGFSSLARECVQRYGIPCVLTGGREDVPFSHEIETMAGQGVINLTGKTSLLELKEVLAGSHAVISCDTGPMHLAVALGKKVIALFGPADPRRTGPFVGEVIRKDLHCSPCNRRACEDPVCMKSITASDVLERLNAVLAK